MPERCHQRNRAIRPKSLIVVVKCQIKGSRHSFPSLIATNSQLQEVPRTIPLNGIVL